MNRERGEGGGGQGILNLLLPIRFTTPLLNPVGSHHLKIPLSAHSPPAPPPGPAPIPHFSPGLPLLSVLLH